MFVEIYQKIDSKLKDKVFEAKLMKYIQECVNKNIEMLSDNSMHEKPIVSAKDTEFIMQIYGDDNEIKQLINKSEYGKKLSVALKTPTYIILYMCFLHYYLNKDYLKANYCLMILDLRMYASIHNKYFVYGSKKEIMDFTIANLSNKFDIRKLESLKKVFEKMNESIIDNFKSGFTSKDDKDHFDFIMALRTRINSLVKNVFSEFENNRKHGYYLNVDKLDTHADSGDYKERGSDSALVISKADSFQISFVSKPLLTDIIKGLSRENQISYNDLYKLIEDIKDEYIKQLRNSSICIFNIILNYKKDADFKLICNTMFIPYILNEFKKNNSKDLNILQLKEQLDFMLNQTSRIFKTTQREATRSSYRRAVLMYICFAIQNFICK